MLYVIKLEKSSHDEKNRKNKEQSLRETLTEMKYN